MFNNQPLGVIESKKAESLHGVESTGTSASLVKRSSSVHSSTPKMDLEPTTVKVKSQTSLLSDLESAFAKVSSSISIPKILKPEPVKESGSPFFKIGTPEPFSDFKLMYVNGWNTTTDQAQSAGKRFSEIMDGQEVEVFHNPSSGLGGVLQAMGNRLDIGHESDTVNKLADKLYEVLQTTDLELNMLVHSHGGAVTADALGVVEKKLQMDGLQQDEIHEIMQRVRVVGLGTLASQSDFPTGVTLTKISNPDDPVPEMASTDLFGRVEDLKYEIDDSFSKLDKTMDEFAKAVSGGMTTAVDGFCSLGPKVISGIGECIGLSVEKEGLEVMRGMARTGELISGLTYGIGKFMGEIVSIDEGGISVHLNPKYLARSHLVESHSFTKGYLGDEKHISKLKSSFA